MTARIPDRSTQLLLRVIKIINPIVAALLKSPLHALGGSTNILLLHFQGRKSGRWYATPVSFIRDGDTLRVFTDAAWWKNLRDRPDARVHLHGKQRAVRARTRSGGGPEVEKAILEHLTRVPRDARYYSVRVENGEPSRADIAAAAPHTIVIELELVD